jgi:DNA-binding transcriptional LysR family regulator
LKAFVQAYPDVRLDIRFMDSEEACLAVEHGELELAIVTLPPSPATVLQTEKVWDDPLAIVVACDHPLAQKHRPSLKDLASHPVILPATGTYTRQIAEKAFRIRGIRLDVTLSTNYLETIRMLVSVGIGWSLLPVTMLDRQVSEIAVPELKLSRNLGVVIHRERTLSNAAIALMERLQHAAAKQPA